MKKRLIACCFVMSLIIICSSPLKAQAEAETITALDAPPLNIALLKHEKQEWQFLRTKLEIERTRAESYRTSLGSFMNQYATQLTVPIIPLFSYIGALIAQNQLRLENGGLWEVGTGITIGLAYVTKGIISLIGWLLESRSSVNYAALNNFIRTWREYRARCPKHVYPLFDYLAQDYEMHDSIKTIDAHQAHIIMVTTHGLAQVAEQADFKLLEPLSPPTFQTNATCATSHKSIIPELVAQEYGTKQQWEYLAKQLGLLNPTYAVSTTTQTMLHTFMVPLTLLIGLPFGAFIGAQSMRIIKERYKRAGMVYGGSLGAALTLLLTHLFGASEEHAWFHNQLITFIEHWNYHRAYSPPALYPMFDELHVLYIDNNRQLNLNQKFIKELFQMIAIMWIKVTVSEE